MPMVTSTTNIRTPAKSRRATLQAGVVAVIAGLAPPVVAKAAAAASADTELCQLATAHEKACGEILRLENTKCATDEDYLDLDSFRETAVKRATELQATTPAGAKAKAAILVGEAGLLWSTSGPPHSRLGVSLARDLLCGDAS